MKSQVGNPTGIVVTILIIAISIGLGVAILSSTFTSIEGTIVSTDNFDSRTEGQNPNDNWYTYTETGWATAEVDATEYHTTHQHSGSYSFYINDTTAPETDLATFTIPSNTWEAISIWTYVNSTPSIIEYGHNSTNLSFCKSNGDVAGHFEIQDGYLAFKNDSATAFTYAMANETWYQLKVVFDYADDEVTASVLDTGGSTLSSGTIAMKAAGTDFTEIASIKMYGNSTVPCGTVTGQSARLWFDDLSCSLDETLASSLDSYESQAQQSLTLAIILIIVLAAVAILGTVLLLRRLQP